MYGLNQASSTIGASLTSAPSPTMEALQKHIGERTSRSETSRMWDEFYRLQNEQAVVIQFLVGEIDKLKAAIEPVKEDVKQAA